MNEEDNPIIGYVGNNEDNTTECAEVTDITDINPLIILAKIKESENLKSLKGVIDSLVPSRLVSGRAMTLIRVVKCMKTLTLLPTDFPVGISGMSKKLAGIYWKNLYWKNWRLNIILVQLSTNRSGALRSRISLASLRLFRFPKSESTSISANSMPRRIAIAFLILASMLTL